MLKDYQKSPHYQTICSKTLFLMCVYAFDTEYCLHRNTVCWGCTVIVGGKKHVLKLLRKMYEYYEIDWMARIKVKWERRNVSVLTMTKIKNFYLSIPLLTSLHFM